MPIPSRKDVAVEDTWDLTPLYPSNAAWHEAYSAAEPRIERISSFEGKLGTGGASTLAQALSVYLESSREIEQLYAYAHLLSDGDTADAEHLGMLEQAISLYTRFGARCSFLTPELLAIDAEQMDQLLASEALKPYRRMLREILRFRPHTLSKSEELLLANATEVLMGPEKIFGQLNNADLSFGTVEHQGTEKPLTHASYATFLRDKDRDVRQKAYEQFYAAYDGTKNTIAMSLATSVKRDIFLARSKNYNSALERSLFPDDVDPQVYRTLIDTVSENLAPLHRYYELRRKVLQLDSLRLFDTYVPLVAEIEMHHDFEEAVALLHSALQPLGDEYRSTLQNGLLHLRWADRFENKGKRSGAYHSGSYDSPPYMLLNYQRENLSDVFTLAHEAGHAMHSYYSNKHQPYQDHSYTIFVAEVASTFNEQLLMGELRKRFSKQPEVMTYLINHQIDDIKGTFFRQVMFAEFELELHTRAEANKPTTLDAMRSIYRQLLEKYFGPAVSFSAIDELECLRIPHFYSAFYVYKYATGLAAAMSLSNQVVSQGAAAQQRYLHFLKSGASKRPLELLRDAGVDLTEPRSMQVLTEKFSELVSELESKLGK